MTPKGSLYSGKGIGFPTVQRSPLDNHTKLDSDLEMKVKEIDGIQAYRLVKLLRTNMTTLRPQNVVTNASLLAVVGLVSLALFGIIDIVIAWIGSFSSVILGLTIGEVIGWLRRRRS